MGWLGTTERANGKTLTLWYVFKTKVFTSLSQDNWCKMKSIIKPCMLCDQRLKIKKSFLWSKMLTDVETPCGENKKHLEEKGNKQMCCSTETTMPFFLNNTIKGSIIGPIFPLCLGIMYCERRDPCITMERGSIRCCSPSASWSKPHTSDSVYPTSSTAIHFIDLHKKPACQGHYWIQCKSRNTSFNC